jgi:prepilin-type N-terminal cleavage/methylation domain-containing protein
MFLETRKKVAGHGDGYEKPPRGFTLVEIIVVSAIVLVLAAAAIPIYTGYVDSVRRDAVSNLAQTAAAAASSYYKRTNTSVTVFTPNSDPLKLFYDGNKYSVSAMSSGNYIGVTDAKRTIYSAAVQYR